MKRNNKGFTLAELLIVVAIIAVLVAIAIPVFTSRLEQSRETTDIANLRSAYAAGQVAALSGLSTKTGSAIDYPKSTIYYQPNDGDGLVSKVSLAAKIGQGTQTNGNADTSKLPKECSYHTDKDVRQSTITLQFGNTGLNKVKFTTEK